ncbi:MAG: indolepyruvate oxidoreductase subunit beta family protein, partial [Proteobacteria bacterium]|nr:indolepyruvate oxidoreductase subunit beta family protein [Pseudomonadota bacterium]
GGEGGGVLADWLVAAATAEGFPVQSTSIPGVAQRTGATTYYIEIFPARTEMLGGRRPVFALTPNPGNIDVMVASELIEAGRAMQNGYVTPDRTTLIASTHRVYAVSEKIAMTDGRFDATRVHRAAGELAKRVVLSDMASLARASGTVINAVLFGAMAGSGALPIPRERCEAAIREAGRGAEASLRGFAVGFKLAAGEVPPITAAPVPRVATPDERVRQEFPAACHRLLAAGVARLIDYQDAGYAALYLDRLAPLLARDRAAPDGAESYKLINETGRHLALWMAYEDVIRVADLKTRASRLERVTREVGAKPGEPIVVAEFLKPGLDEFCAVLPVGPARWLRAWAVARGLERRLNVGLRVKTTTVSGFLVLRSLAWLRPWRRRTSRFADEQAAIERWLAAIVSEAARDPERSLEIVECARMIKGYGDTLRRGAANFSRIFGAAQQGAPAAWIRRAREAALADPEGDALERVLAEITAVPASDRRRAVQAAD